MTDAFPRLPTFCLPTFCLPTFRLPHGGGPCCFMQWWRDPTARDNDQVLSVTLSGFQVG